METIVRLEGAVQFTLEKLIELGYFKTRNEAIRAGVLGLGREYGLKMTAQEAEDALALRKMQQMDLEVSEGRRRLVPLEKVLKKHKIKRSDL
ncbi:MAG: hypothetical protein V1676_00195 [Candidatus Diapherotrites archaeon]